MVDVKIHLLGTPLMTLAGSPVHIKRRKAQALMAYLAATCKSHHREHLSTLLWPDVNATQSSANLRTILWALNRTPLSPYLSINRETVTLSTHTGLWIDVVEFRKHIATTTAHHPGLSAPCEACLNHLIQAERLYSSHFLAGFNLDDTLEFDQWQTQETQALLTEVTNLLDNLTKIHKEYSDWDAAIRYARRLVALDSYHEPAHAQLIQILAMSGQLAEAIQQYDRFRVLLEQDQLEPSDVLIQLMHQIKNHEIQPCPSIRRWHVPGNEIPKPLTPFVGRQHELERLRILTGKPETRLITLTGLGGTGKTRLALQTAALLSRKYRDGVVWIPLATIESCEDVIPLVLRNLKIKVSHTHMASTELVNILIDHLKQRQIMLILDNAEHLLNGLGFINRILMETTHVHLLVTSRIRLNILAETLCEVNGLTYPDHLEPQGAFRHPQNTDEWDAIILFVQNAQRASGDFILTGENRDAVVEICRMVRGIPLAIEIASAWTRVLSCHDIAREIRSNKDFLEANYTDVSSRHQSFRAVFEHTWCLLNPGAQTVFRKLAVMHGEFCRKAAEEIAGASLADLTCLFDTSFIHKIAQDRFEMHELLRQYSREKMDALGDEKAIMEMRHSRYYLDMITGLEPSLKNQHQKDALTTLARSIENIRVAWFTSLHHKEYRHVILAVPALFIYFDVRTLLLEGWNLFHRSCNILTEQPVCDEQHYLLGILMILKSWFIRHSRHTLALEISTSGTEILLDTSYRGREWALACNLSVLIDREGWSHEYIPILDQCHSIFRAEYDDWGRSLTLEAKACCLFRSNMDDSETFVKQSLQIRRSNGDIWGIAMSLTFLGAIQETRGNIKAAWQHYADSLRFRRDLDHDVGGMITCLRGMGRIARGTGNCLAAKDLYTQCYVLAKEVQDHHAMAQSLINIGEMEQELQKFQEAIESFDGAMDLRERKNLDLSILDIMLKKARAYIQLEKYHEAIIILHQMTTYPDLNPALQEEIETLLLKLQT